MNRSARRVLATLVPALLCAHAVHAVDAAAKATATKKQVSPFSMELSAGAQYDSNVSVDEIDATTSVGDHAALLDADFGYKLPVAKDTALQLGYNFSQSLHQDYSEFDLQNHLLSADLSHDFGALDAGTTLRYVHTRLDNSPYLDTAQVSPWVSRFFGKKLFVRADYTYSDKSFDELDPTTTLRQRDATQHAAGADAYWFLNGVRTYVVTGYRYKAEDARDAQYDYRSHTLKLKLTQRFRLLSHDASLKLGWQYESRDYRSATPAIGAKRDDDRHRFQAELEVPFADRLFATLQYEHGAYDSNLPSADYTQNVVSLKLGYRL